VDETLAEKFWRGKSPIGQRMYQPDSAEEVGRTGPNTRWLTVVGVVAEVKLRGLASPEERIGAYYFPFAQQPVGGMTLVARIDGDPLRMASALRREIAALDPELPLYDVQTMAERVDSSVAGRRVAVTLAAAFGGVALLLATLGIYGVLAYQVTQRTREIGIRMALGSESGRVFRLIVSEGAVLLGVGLVLGLGGLFVLRRALESQLYGVSPFEPMVLAAVSGVLAAVALAACLVPARRAARIDPAVALTE
jgi:putative ABC transport system permease protein